jgi:hypothetical protein
MRMLHLFIETSLFTAVWFVCFVHILANVLRRFYSKFQFYERLRSMPGLMTLKASEDMIVSSLYFVHHMVCSSLMIISVFYDIPWLWKTAALMELGLEAADLISICLRLYPHNDELRVPAKGSRIFLILHHIPGIVALIPLLLQNLHENQFLQQIGIWLLLAGAASPAASAFAWTRNPQIFTEAVQAAVVRVLSSMVIVYSRLVVYPLQAIGLYDSVVQTGTAHQIMLMIIVVAGGIMMMFNLLLSGILIAKLFSQLRIVYNHGKVESQQAAMDTFKDKRS